MNRAERRRIDAQNAKRKKVGRVAFREEGPMWTAYYALNDTMDDALLLGSIAMAAVVDHPERRQAFMDLMSGFVADIIENKCGIRPEMPGAEPAPEHERAGRA